MDPHRIKCPASLSYHLNLIALRGIFLTVFSPLRLRFTFFKLLIYKFPGIRFNF